MPNSSAQKRYQIFARAYVSDASMNGTKAAITAGYSKHTAGVQASRLLKNARVRALIDELIRKRAEKLELTGERVLAELSKMGFANMLDYMTVQDGKAVLDLSMLTKEQAAAIQEVTYEEWIEGHGEAAQRIRKTRFKLADKRGSLELLGRHLKLFGVEEDQTRNAVKVIVVDIPRPDRSKV